jgi:P27 family predicted phage terminase small subunit
MPGPAPKPADQRQRRNKRDIGTLPPVPKAQLVSIESARIVPKPPDGLLAITKAAWESFWLTPLAQLITPADRPALDRLFGLYDELDRIWRYARKHRVTAGAAGQDVLNPLYKEADTLRSEVRALEDRFGLTPMARLKLGVKFGEAKRSLGDDDIDGEPDADANFEADAAAIDAIDAETD